MDNARRGCITEAFWPEIRKAYIAGGESYRQLAQRYGVSRSRLGRMGAKEGWEAQRRAWEEARAGETGSRGEPDGAPAQPRQQPEAECAPEERTAARTLAHDGADRGTEAELEAAAKRLELKFFSLLNSCADSPEVDGAELKRLVDSYLSLRRLRPAEGDARQQEGHRCLVDAIRQGKCDAD